MWGSGGLHFSPPEKRNDSEQSKPKIFCVEVGLSMEIALILGKLSISISTSFRKKSQALSVHFNAKLFRTPDRMKREANQPLPFFQFLAVHVRDACFYTQGTFSLSDVGL